MTRAMADGTVADRIEIPVSAISSDVIAETAIGTDGNVDAVIATVIRTTDVGAAGISIRIAVLFCPQITQIDLLNLRNLWIRILGLGHS